MNRKEKKRSESTVNYFFKNMYIVSKSNYNIFFFKIILCRNAKKNDIIAYNYKIIQDRTRVIRYSKIRLIYSRSIYYCERNG